MKKLFLAFGLMLAASVAFSQASTVYKIVKTDTCGYNCIKFFLLNSMPHDGIKVMKGFLYVEEDPNSVYRADDAAKRYGYFDTLTYCPAGFSLIQKGPYLLSSFPKEDTLHKNYAFKVKQW